MIYNFQVLPLYKIPQNIEKLVKKLLQFYDHFELLAENVIYSTFFDKDYFYFSLLNLIQFYIKSAIFVSIRSCYKLLQL